jgi:hypothetical protein
VAGAQDIFVHAMQDQTADAVLIRVSRSGNIEKISWSLVLRVKEIVLNKFWVKHWEYKS